MKFILLIAYFAVMVCIGLYCRKNATDVNGFVLGGRSVGPWLTAFAYGTSYFSAVVFVGYAGQFGWKYGIAATWASREPMRALPMPAQVAAMPYFHPNCPAYPTNTTAEK